MLDEMGFTIPNILQQFLEHFTTKASLGHFIKHIPLISKESLSNDHCLEESVTDVFINSIIFYYLYICNMIVVFWDKEMNYYTDECSK